MDSSSADNNQPVAGNSFGVGVSLRQAREAKGLSLGDVAKQLRIRQPFLLALEEGRHRELPGGTYAIGFLRTYAEFLGLDGEEMIRRFRDEVDDLSPRASLDFPSPESEGRIPGGAVLFLGLVLAGLAYGGWYWLSSRDSNVAEMVPPLPERLNNVLNRPANLTGDMVGRNGDTAAAGSEPATPPPALPPSEGTVTIPVKGSDTSAPEPETDRKDGTPASAVPTAVVAPPATAPAALPPAPAPAAALPPAAAPAPATVTAPPVTPPPPTLSMVDPTQPRIVLKANVDDCWVQIREIDGQLLMSRLLHRGESYPVPNRPGLTLMVGNAGALEILVDGTKAPPLGAGGQVRRDIKLDPDKLLGGG